MGATCQACGGGGEGGRNVFRGYNTDEAQPAKSRRSIESLSQESFRPVVGARTVTPEPSESGSILDRRAMFEKMSKQNANNKGKSQPKEKKKYKWQVKDPKANAITAKPSLSLGRGSASINYEPECDACSSHFHIMDDPANAYNGKGITCSNCKRTGNNELIGDEFYYQCSDCKMTDLCSKCFVTYTTYICVYIM